METSIRAWGSIGLSQTIDGYTRPTLLFPLWWKFLKSCAISPSWNARPGVGSLLYAFPRVVLLSPHIHVNICVLSSWVTPNSFITPWTVAHQAPLSTGFPRQEYWSGWPVPSSGELPDPGIESTSPVSSVCRWILYYGATWKPPQVHVFFPVLGNWTSSLHVLIGRLQSVTLATVTSVCGVMATWWGSVEVRCPEHWPCPWATWGTQRQNDPAVHWQASWWGLQSL